MRSSIARRLGIDIGALTPADRNVEGVVEMMLDATQKFDEPLTARAAVWLACRPVSDRAQRHAARSLSAHGAMTSAGPMQVVSGPVGRERVHYEAPAAAAARDGDESVSRLVQRERPTSIRCSRPRIAHLWFVTIHPFDDGNGRIARAIADMQLARSEKSAQRFYSMSAQIRQERKAYYDILEATQKGDLDITPGWNGFSLALIAPLTAPKDLCGRAHESAVLGEACGGGVQRAPARHAQPAARRLRGQAHLIEVGDDRQVLAGHGAARHQTICVERGILIKDAGGGRSTSYSLVTDGRPE